MADAVANLAGEMARVFSALSLPRAGALREAVRHWRANTAAGMPQPSAQLRRELDSFFRPPDEARPLNTAADVWRRLPWRAGGGGLPDNIAVVELVGPDGVAACDSCRAGAMFQSAGHFYPWHWHAAEEFFVPVSGAATWMAKDEPDSVVAPMEKLIRHRSWQPHAMQTGGEPLLALWFWSGDLDIGKYDFCPPPRRRENAREQQHN